MSLLLQISSIVENKVTRKIGVVKRALGSSTNYTLQVQERQQQPVSWRYKHVRSCTNRGISSSHRNEKQQHLIYNNPTSIIQRNVIFDLNFRQNYSHHIRHLSTTTTDDKNENDHTQTEERPLQMPDKDTELQLADLQATITEEYKRGNFTRALSTSKDLLKQTQQHFGFNVDHPATASAMNNVGLMHKLLGNFTEARQHYVGAMRIYASVCGRDHASYAMTLHNLGNLNKSQVHFDASLKATERLSLVEAAMEYLEESYSIRVVELGEEHPHTVATRSAIGSTLAAQVLYQHKLVEDTKNENNEDSGGASNVSRKQYVALNPQGITEQQWRAAEEHLRLSLKTAIENPRGKQIQDKRNRQNNQKKGKKGKKQNFQKQHINQSSNDDPTSSESVTTLSAASAAQNLAVFLKSLAMTFEEGSRLRKQHMNEAKDLYEKVQQVRTQLLPYDHPDLYATKYSLAELLEVLASSPSSGDGDNNNSDEDDKERKRHQEAANALRQEIIDTYDPPEEDEKDNASEVEDKLGPTDVVVERTEGSKN